jgi:hypothetical protein
MSLGWTPALGQLWSPAARAGVGLIDGSDRSVQSVAPHIASKCQIWNAFQSRNGLKNKPSTATQATSPEMRRVRGASRAGSPRVIAHPGLPRIQTGGSRLIRFL